MFWHITGQVSLLYVIFYYYDHIHSEWNLAVPGFPKLYFKDPVDGHYEDVPNQGTCQSLSVKKLKKIYFLSGLLVYYLNRGDQDKSNGGPGLKAFPPGFQMVSGSAVSRSIGWVDCHFFLPFVLLNCDEGQGQVSIPRLSWLRQQFNTHACVTTPLGRKDTTVSHCNKDFTNNNADQSYQATGSPTPLAKRVTMLGFNSHLAGMV